jgi:hypothetical protein
MSLKPIHQIVTSLSLGFTVAIGCAQVTLAETVEFRLVNKTSVSLIEFYASPSNLDDWENDILGEEVLTPGKATVIAVADTRQACTYDLKGVFSDGDKVEEKAVNICEVGSYTFRER